MSLTQIGEFSFVIATLGAGLSSGSARLFSVAVAVAMITAFTTPLLMARSQALALEVDARLPRPLQTFVSLYGSWLELLRQPRMISGWRLVRRGLLLLVAAAAMLAVIVIAASRNLAALGTLIASRAGLGEQAGSLLAIAAAAIVALPFAIAMMRGGRDLAERLAAEALPLPVRGVDQGRAPRRALALALQVGAILGVGLLVMAVTQPFLPRLSAPALVVLLLALLGIAFWRAAKDLQGHVRATAEVAAHVLASDHRRASTT